MSRKHVAASAILFLTLALATFAGCREGIWVSAPVRQSLEQVEKTFPTPETTSTPVMPAATPGSAAGGAGNPQPDTTGDVAAGKAAFESTCNACHPGGGKGVGPSLVGIAARMTDSEIASLMRNGKGMMPPFAPGLMTDKQLLDITAFLKALR